MSFLLKIAGKERRVRAYRNKKTDYGKHIKEYYIENGVAYISCTVNDYFDVIDLYSVKGYEWLNSSFVRFIEDNATYIPLEYPILLELCGTQFTKEKQDTIIRTIKEYYALKLGEMQNNLHEVYTKIFWLICMAVIFLLLLFLVNTSNLKLFFLEPVTVLFWLFLWEAVDLLIFDRKDEIYEKSCIAQLESMKISFSSRFEDIPIAEEEADRIIREVFDEL